MQKAFDNLVFLVSVAFLACLALAALGFQFPKDVVAYIFDHRWLASSLILLLVWFLVEIISAAAKAAKSNQASGNDKPNPPTPLEQSDHKLREQAFTKANQQEPPTAAFVPLQTMIGLDSVKKEMAELRNYISVQKLRAQQSLKTPKLNLHLVFTGNPGTGKTTVAREIARMYKAMGLLATDRVLEVDRSQLVGGYLGQTAIKTKEVIESALGGILFIDEAYALVHTDNSGRPLPDDLYGKEAIEVLLKELEDRRKSFAVIVAGYTQPMKDFINSNPGLQSRFTRYIHFPDYSADELFQIFQLMCKENEYELDQQAATDLASCLVAAEANIAALGNARFVRNLFENVAQRQASRVSALANPTREDLKKILSPDIVIPRDPIVKQHIGLPLRSDQMRSS